MAGRGRGGATVRCTTVNIARAGFVYLLNRDRRRLQADIAYLRTLCRENHLFDVQPDHCRSGSRQARSVRQPRATFPPMTKAA